MNSLEVVVKELTQTLEKELTESKSLNGEIEKVETAIKQQLEENQKQMLWTKNLWQSIQENEHVLNSILDDGKQ